MRTILTVALTLLLLLGVAMAMNFNPSTDVMTKNADGEYVKIFGPGNFWFDDGRFPNPVLVQNGTAIIGGMGNANQ